jgi:hypothetical protein
MPSIILREPGFIRQTKMNSCWYACLKMLLQWHVGNSNINDSAVSGLASHWTPRSYGEVPRSFRDANGLQYQNDDFTSTDEIGRFLLAYGPFMGGGKVGKFFIGKRHFGHALLIYGVLPDGHILHHDPTLGAHCTIKGDNYLRLQDGERLYYSANPRVEIVGQGS